MLTLHLSLVVAKKSKTSYRRKTLRTCGVKYNLCPTALRPMDVSPNYEINSLVEIIAIYFGCIQLTTITSFFIVVSGYIEAQILALSEELTNLWDEAIEYYKENRDMKTRVIYEEEQKAINVYIRKRLENIIKIHTTIINLFRQIEYIYRRPVFTQYAFAIMAVTAVLLGGLENTWLQMPYTLMMIGIDCQTGQRIIDASITFEHAVYDSKWENFDSTNRKMVLLMLQNAQNTLMLSAGGVATLSVQSFMAVIKFIYSTYTTLRSTMK